MLTRDADVPGLGPRPMRIGVLGGSGVGKSTLLNALLSERLPLLPQGGVGPHTAIAIEICHAHTPYLAVTYHGAARIHALLDACGPETEAKSSTADHEVRALRRLASLCAYGSQFATVSLTEVRAFLLGCLSNAEDDLPPPLRQRALRIHQILGTTAAARTPLRLEAGLDLPLMLRALEEHGTGYLAPLTDRIELGWDCPVLASGLRLVDLPGLGVANDTYQDVTNLGVESLHGVLLVVDRAGLTDSAASFLAAAFGQTAVPASSGPVTPALHSLIVAVTKLDQVVAEARAGRAGRRNQPKESWRQTCAAVAMRAQGAVLAQLQSVLASVMSASAVSKALKRVLVLPVLPLEFQRLHRAEPDEPALVRTADETGIPALVQQLQALAPPLSGARPSFA